MQKKLYRSKIEKIMTGLCGGLGEYFNMSAWIFRLLFIFFGFSLVGVVVYFVASYFVPENPDVPGEFTENKYN